MSEAESPGEVAGDAGAGETGAAPRQFQAKHTDPKSFIIHGLAGLRNAIVPVVAAFFALRDSGSLALIVASVAGIAIMGFATVSAYLRWRKFTYRVNQEDIRVESGVLARTARSVPFERIQDVSLEQKLLPRLFGLVAVKFETGSGGGEDIALQYLREPEGERLRELVRARKDGHSPSESGEAAPAMESEGGASDVADKRLFALDNRRLFTFGLFEFSLAVFAVLGGLAQYADWFVDFEIWDPDLWRGVAQDQQRWLGQIGQIGQVLGAIFGILGLLIVGSATGMVRTYLRDWGFLLEETPRGFRRRRGLLNKTDVVMPIHRVQAVKIATGLLRFRFGWHSLKFVSLAQDSGSSNHMVAPFAKMEEIDPIIRTARFDPADRDLEWHRASTRYRTNGMILEGGFFLLLAVPVAIFAPPGFVLIPLALAALLVFTNYYSWRFHRHAIDHGQLYTGYGLLAPHFQIASRIKLHSVELSQGPIARRSGYATMHFGLAGGKLDIPGVPVERARQLRQAIIESIASTDFARING